MVRGSWSGLGIVGFQFERSRAMALSHGMARSGDVVLSHVVGSLLCAGPLILDGSLTIHGPLKPIGSLPPRPSLRRDGDRHHVRHFSCIELHFRAPSRLGTTRRPRS